jgi:hypothetical protein
MMVRPAGENDFLDAVVVRLQSPRDLRFQRRTFRQSADLVQEEFPPGRLPVPALLDRLQRLERLAPPLQCRQRFVLQIRRQHLRRRRRSVCASHTLKSSARAAETTQDDQQDEHRAHRSVLSKG